MCISKKLLFTLFLLVSSACNKLPSTTIIDQIPTLTQPKSTIFSFSLDDTRWKLLSYVSGKGNPTTLLSETEITIEFISGEFKGNAGCNTYFGSYLSQGNTIKIDHIAITEMYCPVPEKLMEQEANYIQALKQSNNFNISNQRLQILNSQGHTILTFMPLE